MTTREMTSLVRGVLREVAPDVDVDALDPDADLHEAAQIDSVDFLRFVTGLQDATGLEIPESAYPSFGTIRSGAEYLSGSAGHPTSGAPQHR